MPFDTLETPCARCGALNTELVDAGDDLMITELVCRDYEACREIVIMTHLMENGGT